MFKTSTIIKDVDYCHGPGHGVYKGSITLEDIYKGLSNAVLLYCPATQRGFFDPLNPDANDSFDFTNFYVISNPNLELDKNKVNEIAIAFLRDQLMNVELVWNARASEGDTHVIYNKETRELIISGVITIPDSAHRHKAYFTLFKWKENMDLIPEKVTISESGEVMTKKEIVDLLDKKFDPHCKRFLTIYNVVPEQEARIFGQANMNTKRANSAQSARVQKDISPEARFLDYLMSSTTIFERHQVESNKTTIHKNSRKLVPNSTLLNALKPFRKKIYEYEKNIKIRNDLANFIDDFYTRLSHDYKAIDPSAGAVERHTCRQESLIISNVMFSVLFKIAIELWESYHCAGVSWVDHPLFIQVISALNQDVTCEQNETGKINLMSKSNVDWVGKVINEKKQITNNRLSQRSAYEYLKEICNLNDVMMKVKKP